MAGDWIKMEVSTPDKAEVLALTAILGWEDPDLTVGKLFRVWRWFDQHTVDGNAACVTSALLDRIVGVTGFAKAMAQVGWLKITDAGLTLPNFDRHNGKTAKDRAQTAKRVAKHKGNATGNASGNGASVTLNSVPPLPKEDNREDIKTPHTPQGGRKSAISLQTYLDECKASQAKPIPEDDPVFAYAETAGIPNDFLRLQWLKFKSRYTQKGAKRYKSWPQVFRNSVEGNWFHLWYAKDGGYVLTTVGEQARKVHAEAAA